MRSTVVEIPLPASISESIGTSSPIGQPDRYVAGKQFQQRAQRQFSFAGALPLEAGFAIIIVAVGQARNVAQLRVNEQGREIIKQRAAVPDAFIQGKIEEYSRGRSGLPGAF